MKHLFFVAVASCILSGTTNSVKAQTSVHEGRFSSNNQLKSSLKFIEDIELSTPLVSTVTIAEKANTGITTANKIAVVSEIGSGIEQCSPLQFKYALMMNTNVESISNLELYNFIEEWFGTRYRYGGSQKSGIDCSSFSGKLMQEVFGITLPRTAREQFRVTDKVSTEDLVEGDLVFFNTRGGISHVGVYLGNNAFVHSSSHDFVIISSLTEAYYANKFICGGRVAVEKMAEIAGNE